MAYGKPKIPAMSILDAIVADFRRSLEQKQEIFQSGLAYYAYEAKFSCEVSVIARSFQAVEAKGSSKAEQIPEDGEKEAKTKPISASVSGDSKPNPEKK